MASQLSQGGKYVFDLSKNSNNRISLTLIIHVVFRMHMAVCDSMVRYREVFSGALSCIMSNAFHTDIQIPRQFVILVFKKKRYVLQDGRR